MGFEFGDGRGYINKTTKEMKVHCGSEAVWVKLLAIHENKKYAIGLMLNTMLSGTHKWGTLVKIQDTDPNKLAEIKNKVTKIPSKYWNIIY